MIQKYEIFDQKKIFLLGGTINIASYMIILEYFSHVLHHFLFFLKKNLGALATSSRQPRRDNGAVASTPRDICVFTEN